MLIFSQNMEIQFIFCWVWAKLAFLVQVLFKWTVKSMISSFIFLFSWCAILQMRIKSYLQKCGAYLFLDFVSNYCFPFVSKVTRVQFKCTSFLLFPKSQQLLSYFIMHVFLITGISVAPYE